MFTVFAMIPARGGSRGIPRKNLQPLSGKPLIAHTIEAARNSRRISRVMVSTEDPEIAEVSRKHGAEIPFTRPAELATDTASGNAVSRHWLEWVNENTDRPTAVIHLQATSPLRTSEDIDGALALLEQVEVDCVASVCPVSEHPAYMYRLIEKQAVPFLPEGFLPDHRQRAEPLYRLNGAIYATRFETALRAGKFHATPFAPFVMSAERSIDIDAPLDLSIAEAILMNTRVVGKGGNP